MENLLRGYLICDELCSLEIMSRKYSLRNRPKVLFSTKDEKELRLNVSTANPMTGASIFSSDTCCQSTARVTKNRHCSSMSEATTTTASTPKRGFTSNTQDMGFTTQPPTPSKWSLLMPDFSSQMDGIRCDVMWDCSSPDAVKHLRKMQKNGSNPVKEIVKHVKDNESVKAPPTPPLLSMILESRSLHIQKQPEQHNHISRQERVERKRVTKAEQVRQDAQVLLGKILSAVEKKQCFEDVLQAHKSAAISIEPSSESGLSSVINSADGEGKNNEDDTWDDDSLFEEDSFIIQATQNSELINKLTHPALLAHGKQNPIAKETQLLSQTLELYCARSDADNLIITSPTLTETKKEHFTITDTTYEEKENIGAEKTVTENTISAPRVSHNDVQILSGASSGDLSESPRFRFAAKTKCLGKCAQRVDYKLDLSQQVTGAHINAQMVDFDPSVSCVTQLFSQGIKPATKVQQANSRKGDVASVQQDCIKVYHCLANHSESATQCFSRWNPIGMTSKFHRAENIRSTHRGKQVSEHSSNHKLQCCQMEAEFTSEHSPGKASSSKCLLDAGKNFVRKCSNQKHDFLDNNLPKNMLLQIIKIDDMLDSQVIEEYPTPLLTWPLMPETLARPTAPPADYDVDGLDDSYREGVESISQFESFEGLSQKGRQVENKKQYVVHIPEDSIEGDFPKRENSVILPRVACGQNDCQQPKLNLKHTHKGVSSTSQVKYGSKRSSLVFKRGVAFKGSMSELKNSASYKQNAKPFRDCMKLTNGDEESDSLRKTGYFQQQGHENGPQVGPLTTLAKGNAVLEIDAVEGKMTVLKPGKIVQSTSLLAEKPVAITSTLALQLPALHTEPTVKEEDTSCNDDTMEFADEALFESQILALLDEVESAQANQQSGLPGSLQSQSQEYDQASFSSRKCSQEEIEKKRQAALMRRKWSNARPAVQQ